MSTIDLQIIDAAIEFNGPLTFYYKYSKPELKRTVYPILIENKTVLCVDVEAGYKKFKLDGIEIPKEDLGEGFEKFWQETQDSVLPEKNEISCEGCKYDSPGQRDHMGPGGCLECDFFY